jgi:hypothetical protein
MSATRCRCASSTAVSVRSPRPTSTWPLPPTRSSSASTSARRARQPRWPTGRRRDPLLQRSSTRRSKRSRPRSRACSSPSTKSRQPGPGGDPRDLPLLQDRQHRGLHGHQRVIRRNAKVRLLRDGAVVADNLDLASLRGRRTTHPRSARASSVVWCCATSRTSRKATCRGLREGDPTREIRDALRSLSAVAGRPSRAPHNPRLTSAKCRKIAIASR